MEPSVQRSATSASVPQVGSGQRVSSSVVFTGMRGAGTAVTDSPIGDRLVLIDVRE